MSATSDRARQGGRRFEDSTRRRDEKRERIKDASAERRAASKAKSAERKKVNLRNRQGHRKRPVDEGAVAQLMRSMGQLGLLSPITLRIGDAEIEGEVIKGVPILVAGQQRLEAARRLGWSMIDAICVDPCDSLYAELIEIAENLDRWELSALERSKQIAEWVRLCDRRRAEFPDKLSGNSRGRPEGGSAAASRQLGLQEKDVQRAVKIDGMTPAAKKAAAEAGLADNRTALEKIASAPPEKQVEAVKEEAGRRAAKPTRDTSRKARQEWAQVVANELITRYGADVVRAVAQACDNNVFVMPAILAITDNERSAA